MSDTPDTTGSPLGVDLDDPSTDTRGTVGTEKVGEESRSEPQSGSRPEKSEKPKPAKKKSKAAGKASGAKSGGKKGKSGKKGKKSAPASRIPLIAASALAAIATVLAVVFGSLWAADGSDDELARITEQLRTEEEAERVAGDYALNVSKVDHENIDAWRAALESGVTEELKQKMGTAVDVVAPLLTQMQYTSTAEKLAATVAHSDGNQYVVRVFVDMNSTSRQTPDGVTATASYTITLDRASNWTITDVGGIGAGLPGQGGQAGSAEQAPAGGN